MRELEEALGQILKEFPQEKKALHEEIAEVMKKEVDNQIGTTLNDSKGKIRSWQKDRVGSSGGYAAISAEASTVGNESPGAITNYLNSGHKIRAPKVQKKSYKRRVRHHYVSGRQFYEKSIAQIESKAIQAANRFADKLVKNMGG